MWLIAVCIGGDILSEVIGERQNKLAFIRNRRKTPRDYSTSLISSYNSSRSFVHFPVVFFIFSFFSCFALYFFYLMHSRIFKCKCIDIYICSCTHIDLLKVTHTYICLYKSNDSHPRRCMYMCVSETIERAWPNLLSPILLLPLLLCCCVTL